MAAFINTPSTVFKFVHDAAMKRNKWLALTALFSLQRTQEIDDFLLLLSRQPIETFNDSICLTAEAPVFSDGFHQIGRPSVMEEEDALSYAPERSGSEFVWPGGALGDAVSQTLAHVMDQQVGIEIGALIGKGGAGVGEEPLAIFTPVLSEGA